MFSRCGSLVAIDVCAQAGVGVIGWMSGERTSSFVNAPERGAIVCLREANYGT